MPERALVIVPTYNERENIRRLIDTVLATNTVEEHLDRRLGEAPGEHLSVVRQHLGRDTVSPQR